MGGNNEESMNVVDAEGVRAWMEKVKDGTDKPEQSDGKEQYEAVLAEYEGLLNVLGIGSGQLDAKDTVALVGVAIARAFGP